MIRISTKELLTPFENRKREFRSSRNLFETLSMDEFSSPEFDLFYDLEEHFEGEIAERRQSIKESMRKLMIESTKRHEENSNLIKEIRAFIDVSIRNQGASIKTLEIQIRQISKENMLFPCQTKRLFHFQVICITVMKIRDRASISVMPFSTYSNLGLGELAHTKLIVKLANRTMKQPKRVAENVLVGIGETLILNRSLDPSNEDYIKLNDLNEPLELWRNQADDLEPTIEEGEVNDKLMKDIDKARWKDDIIDGLDEYPSYCDLDSKIHFDSAYNMKFSYMIGYEYVDANFIPRLSIIVEDMDNYRDDRMGDVIVRKPFCREVCVKMKRFEGMITIFNGNDSVNYQMVRSHPRFKHLTNAQCNKIPPLLKVSEQDKMNGISYAYQKLKGFYKGILDLGPEFI
uniref:Glycosyl transferase, family 8 n=1 Tax=Tanacetum cinerariifolium TaxID=118510 RepID=A0A699I524_TANCI|nr:glycosyl transferase, family 8 [Tanacetum cinerariifolium]